MIFNTLLGIIVRKAGKIGIRTLKFLMYLFIALVVIVIGVYIAFQSGTVQTYTIKKITAWFAKKYHTEIRIGRVDISFFNKLVLEDVFIADQAKDTILDAKMIKVSISHLNLQRNDFRISSILLVRPYINLYMIDSLDNSNVQFLLNALAGDSEDTTSSSTTSASYLYCKTLEIRDGRLRYKAFRPPSIPSYSINFEDVELRSLNVKIQNLIPGETTKMDIIHISFSEKSGFILNELSAHFRLNNTTIGLREVLINTSNSNLNANYLSMNYPNWKAFSSFIQKVELSAQFIDSTVLDTKDLVFFVPDFKGWDTKLRFNALIKGTVSDLNTKSLKLQFGESSNLNMSLHMKGLPKFDSTWIDFEIKELNTNTSDLQTITLPLPESNNFKLSLPSMMNRMGQIRLSAEFNGYMDHFKSKVHVISNAGNIVARFSMTPDYQTQGSAFDGLIQSENMNIGLILGDSKNFGIVSCTFDAKGIMKNKNLNSKIHGKIHDFKAYGYKYQDIEFDGKYVNKTFEGDLSLDDPNIRFNVNGIFDFSDTISNIEFTTVVSKALLDKLGIDTLHKYSSVSMVMNANLQGSNLDNLRGDITLENTAYTSEIHNFIIKDFTLSLDHDSLSRNIKLSSSLMDAELHGVFNWNSLMASMDKFIYKFIPAWTGKDLVNKEKNKIDTKNEALKSPVKFNFYVDFKNTDDICEAFFPNTKIDPNTSIKGKYDAEKMDMEMEGVSPNLVLSGFKFKNFYLNSFSRDSSFFTNLGCESFIVSEGNHLDNFAVNVRAKSDSIFTDFQWNNWDSVVYRGKIFTLTTLGKHPVKGKEYINIYVAPSELIVADSLWNVSNTNIFIDSSSIKIFNMAISHDDQMINIDGKISENPKDSLTFIVNNIDLSHLNFITERSGIKLGGNFSGSADLFNLYNKPQIFANFEILGLKTNDEDLGDLTLSANWDNEEKININVIAKRKKIKTIDITGFYKPANDQITFTVYLNKLRMNVFEPYLKGIISELRGEVNGSLIIYGTTSKPIVRGTMGFYKNTMKVDYLNTVYTFNDSIQITEDRIVFNKFRLNSGKLSYGEVSGSIYHRNFSNMKLNLLLDAKNFQLLNTTEEENESYFGTAYASGIINVKGPVDDLIVDANISTRPNTNFYIPLTSISEVGENNFITFVKHHNDLDSLQSMEKTPISMSGLQLNLTLDVNPDAEVQLIFDEKVGDIIKGTGYGNIKMEINSNGDFAMFGEYIIEKGSYLFTLQNIVNKQFTVEKGGTIKWSGDPSNAIVDLLAKYSIKKVPIYDLLLDEQQKETKIPVDCELGMKGKLLSPTITFDLDIPSTMVDNKVKSQISSMTEDEKNKQVLSLLIINRFQPLPGLTASSGTSGSGGLTTGELISNQLSYWLSQISNQFDIGVNYHPGDEISSKELEVALSTQLFNDRVSINGNVGVVGGNTNAGTTASSNIVGDFDLDFKITKNGKFRVKAFTKANENSIYENSPYTQGVGLFYREDFNNFPELFKKYTTSDNKKPKKKPVTHKEFIDQREKKKKP